MFLKYLFHSGNPLDFFKLKLPIGKIFCLIISLVFYTKANAQLLETPKTTANNPLFKNFSVKNFVLKRGTTTITFDVVGGHVVGILVQGVDVQDVGRGLVAAWGGRERNIAGLVNSLNTSKVITQAQSVHGFKQDNNGNILRIKIRSLGNAKLWSAYTSLLVHPDSDFPTATNAHGSPKAPHIFRVFSEFQCSYCKQMWDSTQRNWIAKPEVYRVVYYHFPLKAHRNANPAAVASECAAAQGQFWPYADRLFSTVDEWSPQNNPRKHFVNYARTLNLDLNTFQNCLISPAPLTVIRSHYATGLNLGISGTPNVYLNGVQINNYSNSKEISLIRKVTTASPSAAQVISKSLKRFQYF